jgi:hypothetical protein
VAHRDILLNFEDPSEQALVRSVGASGEMSQTTSDFLYVVDTNLSYNKINPYVHLRTYYAVRIRRDRWLDARLTLHLVNVPAPPRVAHYGMGPGGGTLGGPDDYATFLRIYVPAGAELLSRSGWTQPWSPGPAYGKTMFCGYLIVRPGATRTIHLHYIVPPNVFLWSRGISYRLLVPHQPGSHPDQLTVSVTPDEAHSSTWTVRHPVLDWARSLAIPGLPFQPIPLPKPLLAVVAPNHWIEPYAYLGVPDLRG